MFLILFLAILVLIIIECHFLGLRLNKLSIVQFVVLSQVAFSYFGILAMFYGLDDFAIQVNATDKGIILEMLFISGYSIFMLVLGSYLFKQIFPTPGVIPYQKQSIESRLNSRPSEFSLYSLSALLITIVLLIYLNVVPVVALNQALRGSTNLDEARSLMVNQFDGKYHWFSVFFHEIATIVLGSAFVLFLNKRNLKHFALFFIMLFVAMFASVMSLQKSSPAWLLISLIFVYLLYKKNGAISLHAMLKITMAVVLLLLFIFSYVLSIDLNNFTEILMLVFSRAFAGSIQPAYHYLEMFPAHTEFLYGASFPNPMNIFPYTPYELSVEVMKFANPDVVNLDAVSTMPTVYWAELYANFGYFSVFLAPVFVGFMLQFADRAVSSMSNTALKIGFYVWMIMHYKNLAVSSFSQYLFDFYLVIVVLFVFIINFFIKAGSGKIV